MSNGDLGGSGVGGGGGASEGGGSTFGKYQLIASLGRGGMAEVFLAVARGPAGFNKLIVIKRLRDDLAKDAGFVEMFLDEARLAARLNHPNVVHTYEVGDVDGSFYLAMEYLDGQPLHEVIRAARAQGQPLSPALAVRIVADALAGLHYAHELRDYDGTPLHIVHRDVSPHNVFVTYDGQVKLVDFGIAKAASRSASETQVGVLKGKASYMAPEQALGDPTDRRADVFAAGIILWELCVGQRLMQRDSTVTTIRRLLSERIQPPSELVPGFPAELDAIIMRALEREPDLRPATALEMRDALSAWLATQSQRQDELSTRMSLLFAKARVEMERRIETCMRSSASETAALARISYSSRDVTDPSSSRRLHDQSTLIEPGSTPRSLAASVAGPPDSAGQLPSQRGAAPTPSPVTARVSVAVGVGLLSLAGLVGLLLVIVLRNGASRDGLAGAPSASASGAGGAAPPAASVETWVRLHGSNTIGAELAPLLAEAYLKAHGATSVERRPGATKGEVAVVGTRPGKLDAVIEIAAAGSQTAFEDLAALRCDIGMSSRPIKPAEAEQLAKANLGDMTGAASEHVVGLDGIAAIVHPNNAVRSLTTAQLRGLFDGELGDWSLVGGAHAPVVLMARDDKSGTFDTWKHLVMGDASLPASAARFADSEKLSDAVSGEPNAVGFIGLAYVRNARALAVADQDSPALYPSRFTVASEDYPLARRLYLYVPARPSAQALELVNFALSPSGQKLVSDAGFVDLNVGVRDPEACSGRCPARYVEMSRKARRLSLDFRFRRGSTTLDSRGQRDIERLLGFLKDRPNPHLFLLGFSDAQGDNAQNVELSRTRAHAVDEELAAHGLRAQAVLAFGAEMPVASNTTDSGRDRNRRVEVWLGDQ